MSKITLETKINAPIQICYDLSLSVDLHQLSTAKTGEHIVSGIKEGVMKLGECVTWRAKHFGIWQELTSKITEAQPPNYFVDEMQKGIFKSLRHEHHFIEENQITIMKDVFMFESPLGVLGKIVNRIILERYLTSFLQERNFVIKQVAESGKWRDILRRTH